LLPFQNVRGAQNYAQIRGGQQENHVIKVLVAEMCDNLVDNFMVFYERDDQERIRCFMDFPHLAPMSIGVKAIDLAPASRRAGEG